ncbi:MAG: hypothetical protein ABSE73_00165 [Planctomycetota bacterium]
MNAGAERRDLVVLVADGTMGVTVTGLLSRPKALGIRPVLQVLRIHPERDPGCRKRGVAFLNPFRDRYQHALLMFDREGCGEGRASAPALEIEIEEELSRNGWDQRAAVIVIDPELEIWVWSDSPHVDTELGWGGRQPSLRDWLVQQGKLKPGATKPVRPKEALLAALRHVKKEPSKALYHSLAEKVSLARCTDRAFLKLKTTLKGWFGTAPPQ